MSRAAIPAAATPIGCHHSPATTPAAAAYGSGGTAQGSRGRVRPARHGGDHRVGPHDHGQRRVGGEGTPDGERFTTGEAGLGPVRRGLDGRGAGPGADPDQQQAVPPA